jgi:hypothetical protein
VMLAPDTVTVITTPLIDGVPLVPEDTGVRIQLPFRFAGVPAVTATALGVVLPPPQPMNRPRAATAARVHICRIFFESI